MIRGAQLQVAGGCAGERSKPEQQAQAATVNECNAASIDHDIGLPRQKFLDERFKRGRLVALDDPSRTRQHGDVTDGPTRDGQGHGRPTLRARAPSARASWECVGDQLRLNPATSGDHHVLLSRRRNRSSEQPRGPPAARSPTPARPSSCRTHGMSRAPEEDSTAHDRQPSRPARGPMRPTIAR